MAKYVYDNRWEVLLYFKESLFFAGGYEAVVVGSGKPGLKRSFLVPPHLYDKRVKQGWYVPLASAEIAELLYV